MFRQIMILFRVWGRISCELFYEIYVFEGILCDFSTTGDTVAPGSVLNEHVHNKR